MMPWSSLECQSMPGRLPALSVGATGHLDSAAASCCWLILAMVVGAGH